MLFTDQLNNSIVLDSYPKRIISIVPSQSELLWDLGLRDELVGITKFCIHPKEMFDSIERVGGTKNLNIDKIRALKPDLIIGNKEENEQAQILELQKEFPVWMSDIYHLEDALKMIELVGQLVNQSSKANFIKNSIQHSFLNYTKGSQNRLISYLEQTIHGCRKGHFYRRYVTENRNTKCVGTKQSLSRTMFR
jgi:ABC-type Fe3+-hydroxamate transport system substrate-binding protein